MHSYGAPIKILKLTTQIRFLWNQIKKNMIFSLKGIVQELTPTYVVIEVNGGVIM